MVEILDGVLRDSERLSGRLQEPSSASQYRLPIASKTTLGGVKIPEDGYITIDENGNIRIAAIVLPTLGYSEIEEGQSNE